MNDLPPILDDATRLQAQGEPFALATVVRLEGPGYRRPGARMLVSASGRRTGAISAGCLEAEVVQYALRTLQAQAPRVVRFDVQDDDSMLGFGTGCGGRVHVLIEPVSLPDRLNVIEFLRDQLERRQPAVLGTVIDAGRLLASELGRRLLLREDGTFLKDIEDASLLSQAMRDAPALLQASSSTIRHYTIRSTEVSVLFERLQPRLQLVIVGNGSDVAPLAGFAADLGWRVVVAGSLPAAELAARFPRAHEHVFLMHPEQFPAHVAIDGRTAVVIMAHNYDRDRTILGAALASPACYVGVLGPRSRTERMLTELGARDDEYATQLHAPVGLDIGTETPAEIALSAVAEIQAVVNGRPGGHLKDRHGAIHESVHTS